MPRTRMAILLAGGILTLAAGTAVADQVTMKFRLVVHNIEETVQDVPNAPGHSVHVSRSAGTAVFEDGRIANKTFVEFGDDTDVRGDFTGYSTYTFENGDRLDLKYIGEWTQDHVGGDYQVLSGTGAFAGAKGTGRFDDVETGWDGARLFEGQLVLELPAS